MLELYMGLTCIIWVCCFFFALTEIVKEESVEHRKKKAVAVVVVLAWLVYTVFATSEVTVLIRQ